MKNWFLYKVYKLNRSLFVFFVLFLAGTLFTNLSGWQANPFFVWGMFSEKEDSSITKPVLRITVNDSAVINYTRDHTDANKFFLISPLQQYILMKKNNGEDPTAVFLKRKLGDYYSHLQNAASKVLNSANEYNLFLPWYKRYLEQTLRINIYTYKLEILQTRYAVSNKVEVISAELIDTWKQ